MSDEYINPNQGRGKAGAFSFSITSKDARGLKQAMQTLPVIPARLTWSGSGGGGAGYTRLYFSGIPAEEANRLLAHFRHTIRRRKRGGIKVIINY